eukprot:3466313-Rhodomonas_salina.1
MSGTTLADAVTPSYTMSGTDLGYAASRQWDWQHQTRPPPSSDLPPIELQHVGVGDQVTFHVLTHADTRGQWGAQDAIGWGSQADGHVTLFGGRNTVGGCKQALLEAWTDADVCCRMLGGGRKGRVT